jgi:hypothetical protein
MIEGRESNLAALSFLRSEVRASLGPLGLQW